MSISRFDKKKALSLKNRLDLVSAEFSLSREIERDAIAPSLKYKDRNDIEMSAFLCALFAYGKVEQIIKDVENLLRPMGKSPSNWVVETKPKDIKRAIQGWKHRFNDENDVFPVLLAFKEIYESSNIEESLRLNKKMSAFEIVSRISKTFKALPANTKGLKISKSKSFNHMFPLPEDGSACKRLNLFLRWMVGKSNFDLSIWSSVTPAQLVIPLDVHLMRQSIRLGLTKRKTATWKTAEDVTESLKSLDPNDPTRFDFAICHMGINQKSI